MYFLIGFIIGTLAFWASKVSIILGVAVAFVGGLILGFHIGEEEEEGKDN